MVDVEVFCDADRIFRDPLADVLVADALGHDGGQRRGVRILALVVFLHHVVRDEAPFGVRPARILDQRVHIDAKRVADTLDLDVLIEAVLVAILRQQTDVALAIGDLVLAGRIVGHVGVGHILDMPHNAVQNLRNLDICLIVDRDDLARGAVLALLVRHLTDVLRELVDREARPRVDRLPLHRSASGEHVLRPLPLVVRRPGHEAQVVKLIFAGFGIGADRLAQAIAHHLQRIAVIFLSGRSRPATAGDFARAFDARGILIDGRHYFFFGAALPAALR